LAPEVWLTILCILFAAAAYTLRVVERAPRLRTLLAALAIASLTLAVVIYGIETAKIVASMDSSGGGGHGPS